MSNPTIHKGMTTGTAQSHQRSRKKYMTTKSKIRKSPPAIANPKSERNFPPFTPGKSDVSHIAAIHTLIARAAAIIGLSPIQMWWRVISRLTMELTHAGPETVDREAELR